MRKIAIAVVTLGAVLSVSAGAEDWSGAPIDGGYYGYVANGEMPTGLPTALAGNESIILTCSSAGGGLIMYGPSFFQNCPVGQDTGLIFAPISSFARSSTVDALAGQLATVSGTMATVSSTLGGLQGQVTSLNDRVGALETTVGSLATSGSVNALSARVTTTEGQIASLSTSVAGVSQAVQAVQAEVSTLGTNLTGRVGLLETSVAALATSASVNALSTRVTSAEGQLAAMQQDLTALATFIPEAMQEMQQEARAGAAMAASLETVAPPAGSKNRIGFASANYNGATALAVSYVRQEGRIDASVGVAISGNEAMARAGFGLSW